MGANPDGTGNRLLGRTIRSGGTHSSTVGAGESPVVLRAMDVLDKKLDRPKGDARKG